MELKGVPIEGDIGRLLKENFTSVHRPGYKRYNGVCLPYCHDDYANQIENLEVRDDDVWVISYPKTGTI